MVYIFLRFLTRITLQLSFKRVEVNGKQNIPKDKPIILACNHPTAFLEPILLACWLRQGIYFLIRGDMWKGGALGWLLDQVHGLPIFRMRDGINNVKLNDQTFEKSVDLVHQHKPLLIFAEGTNSQVRRIRPLQKGMARIAFQTLDKYPQDQVHIVPVGMVYSHPTQFRGSVSITFGKPILANDFKQDQEHEKQNIKTLTKTVEKAIKEQCLPNITKQQEDQYEQVLYASAKCGQSFTDQWRTALSRFQQIEDKDSIDTSVNANLQNVTLRKQLHIGHWILLVLGFIPGVIGKLLFWLPMFLADRFTKGKVKRQIFYLSLRVAASMLLVIVWLAIFKWGLFFATGNFWIFIGMLLLGLFSIFYFDLWRIATAQNKYTTTDSDQ